MHGVGIGAAKCHEREAIRTHRKERAGFLQDSHISGIEVRKLVVELCGIGEVHRRENFLKAGTGLKECHRILPAGGFDDIQYSDSVGYIRRT